MKTIIIVLLLCLGQLVSAQVTGVVQDAIGFPEQDAEVLVKGTDKKAYTDENGRFSIDARIGDVLVITGTDSTVEEFKVLRPDMGNLKLGTTIELEVVNIVYGKVKKEEATIAVQSIKGEEISGISSPTVTGALQGAATGLVVSQNSGAPGAAFSVRMRGAKTILGSNEPLYVVDGMVYTTGSFGTMSYGGQQNDALSNLNFSDIESIVVLKDAAATALYGSRGSNGIVLITTKTGARNDIRISINSYTGIQNAIKKPNMMSTGEYYKWADKAFKNAGYADGFRSYAEGMADRNDPESLTKLYADGERNTYLDAVYKKNVPVQSLDVSLAGGGEKSNYYIGANTYRQKGVIVGQDYVKNNFRVNFATEASDWLKFNVAANAIKQKTDKVNGDNNIYSPLTAAQLERPGRKIYNEDGSFSTKGFNYTNPLQAARLSIGKEEIVRFIGNFGADARVIENLNYRADLGFDRLDFTAHRYFPASTNQGAGSNGEALMQQRQATRWTLNNSLNYNKRFGDLDFNVLVGVSFEGYKRELSSMASIDFPNDQFIYPYSGSEITAGSYYPTKNKLFSYFGRMNLSYRNKLFLSASMRSDESSVFGESNRIGYFPGVSLGYLISNEPWFKDNLSAVNSLKFRGSWGITGNNSGINDFDAKAYYTGQKYATLSGTAITQLASNDLKWEKTQMYNLGFDLSLFHSRINLVYDFYTSKTTDLLNTRPLPLSSGFISIVSNVGSVKNIGHEITLDAAVIDAAFKWNSSISFSFNENEVTDLLRDANGNYIPVSSGFVNRIDVGQPLSYFYGLKTDGLYKEGDIIPEYLKKIGVTYGDVKYIDLNGDGIITDDDRTFIGRSDPKFTGYFRNTFAYAGFDLAVNFYFSVGNDLYNNSLAYAGASGSFSFNKFASENNYYTEVNTNTNTPRPIYGAPQSHNNQDSDRFVEDASFLRMKELTLGYTIPKKYLGGYGVRLYISGENLWTWTNYSGLDPEVNTFGNSDTNRGTDFFTQGMNRVWKVGVNVNF